MLIAIQIDKISDRNKYAKGHCASFNLFAKYHEERGEFIKSVEFYNKALRIYDDIGDKHGKASIVTWEVATAIKQTTRKQ